MVNLIDSHEQKTNFVFTKIFIKFGNLGTMPTFTFIQQYFKGLPIAASK